MLVSERTNDSALSLPDILTAGAGDRLGRMFLFQRFLTSRTLSLPHIHTWLPGATARLIGKGPPVCSFLHNAVFSNEPVARVGDTRGAVAVVIISGGSLRILHFFMLDVGLAERVCPRDCTY